MIRIHFLNVGHGDCIIFESVATSRNTIIDINRSSMMDEHSTGELFDSLVDLLPPTEKLVHSLRPYTLQQLYEMNSFDSAITDPIQYILTNNLSPVFRFISTHPHMDHISGLFELSQRIKLNGLWILQNEFTQERELLSNSQRSDWDFYVRYRDGGDDDNFWVRRPKEGASSHYWREDGITILAPNSQLIKQAKDQSNPNNMSYVLIISYGGHKIVLGGDGEEETWEYLLNTYVEDLSDVLILKASHHGRDSGYYQPILEIMKPKYTIVSVGKKPSTDASNKYRQYSENVWSTRWKGNIVFTIGSDGTVDYNTQFDR
ncbi:MAG: ComEC/Rec2 family competence protein [Candidatus Hodarchaeales archaeon]